MDKAAETMLNNIPEKTGKSLDEWLKILKAKAFSKHSEAVKFLKEEHNMTHGFANTIVHLSKGDNDSSEDLVSSQYKGKENLKIIYDELAKKIQVFGNDIEFAPKKAYVSVRRSKQFAIIQPSTKTRLDLGLNIKNKEAEGKLEVSGTFNAMCSHRVRLESLNDLSDDVWAWLKEAYDRA
jgi:predicted transport protein